MSENRCAHWLGEKSRHCWALPTRRYLVGFRCLKHEPAKIAPYGGARR